MHPTFKTIWEKRVVVLVYWPRMLLKEMADDPNMSKAFMLAAETGFAIMGISAPKTCDQAEECRAY